MDNDESLSDNVIDYLESEYGDIIDPPKTGVRAPGKGGSPSDTSNYGSEESEEERARHYRYGCGRPPVSKPPRTPGPLPD